MLKVARLQDRIPAVAELHRFILCTGSSRGTPHEGRGCDRSIGSTVSDAIIRSWLWSTATRSSTLGYFSRLLQVLIIDPKFSGSRFSTGRLLAIEDFTFSLHFIGLAARSLFVSCCFPFLLFHSMGWCCWVRVFGLIGC